MTSQTLYVPANIPISYLPKLAIVAMFYIPAIPQVITTTGRGSLSVRHRKGWSGSSVPKLSIDPAIFPKHKCIWKVRILSPLPFKL